MTTERPAVWVALEIVCRRILNGTIDLRDRPDVDLRQHELERSA